MANSYVEYTTAGSGTNGLGQTTFTAPTQFLSINDIRVKGYNGSSWTELTISTRGTTTVTLSAAPSAYSKIRVFRSSTTEALIDFQNGSRLAESDLDTAYRQSLFVAQEVAEDADPEGGSGIGNIVNSQLAGGITNDKLAGGITNAQLAGSIADDKLASGVGTSANNLVKLDSNAKLPAVDGSQLTNLSISLVAFACKRNKTSSGAEAVNGDIVFNQVQTNVGSAYDNTTGRFTAPTAGTYFFAFHGMGCGAGASAVPAAGTLSGHFRKNGADAGFGKFHSYITSSTSYPNIGSSMIITLAQNDYIQVHMSDNYIYSEQGAHYNQFCGHLIG